MKILWTRVGAEVAEMAKKVAQLKGITLSEYVRHLIIEDLDSRFPFGADPVAHQASTNLEGQDGVGKP